MEAQPARAISSSFFFSFRSAHSHKTDDEVAGGKQIAMARIDKNEMKNVFRIFGVLGAD